MRLALATAAVTAVVVAPAAQAASLPEAPGCPLFPATNVWNKPVNRLPLRERSATLVRSIGADLRLHADFGSGLWDGGPIGIPYAVVNGAQAKSSVDFLY